MLFQFAPENPFRHETAIDIRRANKQNRHFRPCFFGTYIIKSNKFNIIFQVEAISRYFIDGQYAYLSIGNSKQAYGDASV
jgi:hypothetical protein